MKFLALALILFACLPTHAALRAGAAAVDVTPAVLPVLVNGGMFTRSVDVVNTRVHARALVLADGKEQVAIVVVDSCMMGRTLLDEVKARAAPRTGIATHRMLISATHAHSAPSSMACLGTDADPRYVPFLRDKIVEAMVLAQQHLEPAKVGWAKANAASYTALRRWIRRPDRLAEDPFGNPTVRANMHAGSNWDDVTGEAGPEDPDLTLISIQSLQGRPIAVLGNFSMHYFGDRDISADYFGLFAEGLKARLAPEASAHHPPFVGILSHGCSGDIYRVDYKIPAKDRPNPTITEYTRGLLDLATQALQGVHHRGDVDLAMAERRLPLNYRVPDKQRLEWAQRVLADMGDRAAKTTTEIYAREQVLLHATPRTEVVVQALRLGDIAIATVPTETYAVTGLKVKAASPLPKCMVIELANGGDGYIPPPEQHRFGGYNTWAARSAGLEVLAEPKIAEAAIALLETVSAQPRRPWQLAVGPVTQSLLQAKPYAYWRLNEFTGPVAVDATGQGRNATFEPDITYYLEGPRSPAFCGADDINRAPHFVGGRLHASLPDRDGRYTVLLWLWNGMPADGREVSGWFLSRGPDHGLGLHGEHLGIGGSAGHTGRLVYVHGNDPTRVVAGKTVIPRWEWHPVAVVRDGGSVRVYLGGQLEIETQVPPSPSHAAGSWFFGGRSDNHFNWEGRLDEIAVFDRPLPAEEIARWQASDPGADSPETALGPAPSRSVHVPDPAVWRTPPIRSQGFQFEIQISSLGTSYDPERVRASIRGHNLGEYDSAVSPVIAAEWGYSFTHLDGQTDGAGRKIQAGYPTPPASRADCLPVIEAFLKRQYIAGAGHPWASMNGHFPWHHYAAEMGFDQLGSEIGENINNCQWHVALTRGAARQYRRPWFIDFSAWHGPSINDYSEGRIWGEYSHPDHGHSMSLFERSLFMSYLAGAGQITAEAGGAIAFLNSLDEQGRYRLSPYGEVCRRFREFSLAHPDVGIPFTPFGVVLDYHHGAYPGFGKRKAFWHFDYTAGDRMTWDLIDQIWPGGWEVMGRNEVGSLVNGPYGDTFDILLQNAPQHVLNSYPCLILSGDVRLAAEEVVRYTHYVHQGGTLLLNTAYLPQFTGLSVPSEGTAGSRRDITLGRGRISVYGPEFQVGSLAPLLREERNRRLPVSVTPGVQFLVNLRPHSVVVTLINNDGITKEPRQKPVLDRSQDRVVSVRYQGERRLTAATDMRRNSNLPLNPNQAVDVPVPAGEVAVVELHLEGFNR